MSFFNKVVSVRHSVYYNCKNTKYTLASLQGGLFCPIHWCIFCSTQRQIQLKRQERSKDERLTQQNNNTRQYGYQSPRAESGRQDVRLHVAGQDGVFTVTGADSDGQGVGAAHGG